MAQNAFPTPSVATIVNAVLSLRRGRLAGDDPWKGDGLEWTASSPPPTYNFTWLPTVRDRYAAWTNPREQPVVTGLRVDRPEVLVTRVMDADPDHITELPRWTLTPLLTGLAIGAMFIIAIFTPWGIPIGALLAAIVLVVWFWPKPPHRQEMLEEDP